MSNWSQEEVNVLKQARGGGNEQGDNEHDEAAAPVRAKAVAVALMSRVERQTKLFDAVAAGDVEMCQHILASGVSSTTRNAHGQTALEVSVFTRQTCKDSSCSRAKIVQMLSDGWD